MGLSPLIVFPSITMDFDLNFDLITGDDDPTLGMVFADESTVWDPFTNESPLFGDLQQDGEEDFCDKMFRTLAGEQF